MYARAILIVFATMLTYGCASMHDSPEYHRHRNSQLIEPMGGGDFLYFDVITTPEYPADSEAAEDQRMKWLASWMEVRKFCPAGYEVVERREFETLEHNPGNYDLRYKVQCQAPPAADS